MTRFSEITPEAMAELVRRFYARARQDEVLGPLFNAAITDWPPHLARITAFWTATMLGVGRYEGNAMAAHLKHPIQPPMFDRWLSLWGEAAYEVFAPEAAARLTDRAERIAESLKLALFFKLPAKDGLAWRLNGRQAGVAGLEHDAFCRNRQNAKSCSLTLESSLFFPF